MDREYDIFEKVQGGSPIRRDRVRGPREAHSTLTKLAKTSENEFYVMCVPTREVLERANSPRHKAPNG
jgi:hypothetical protein